MGGNAIFISGKITGDPNYRCKFFKAEEELREKGYTKIMNPAMLPEGFEWGDYMDITMAMLKACDTIYFLADWKESQGARIERVMAVECGHTILYQNPLDAPKMP